MSGPVAPRGKSGEHAEVRLPAIVAIGFTGQRHLPDEARCRAALSELLKKRKASAEGAVYGVSSIAPGADLLFAECCLELGIPLRILLPARLESVRADFDASTWPRVERVLAAAMSVTVVANHEVRNEGYYECGIEAVQHSQFLIALWSGEENDTGEIVQFARATGKPVVWIHSETGAIEMIGDVIDAPILHDAELQFLNDLPDAGAPLTAQPPGDLARAWFQKIDQNASRYAPEVRRMASIPILFTAVAAVFSGVAARNPNAMALLAAGAVLGVCAAVLPAALRLQRRQTLWVRTRTAAEVCRSVLALWATPALYEVMGPEVIPEFAGMLQSLNFLKMAHGQERGVSLQEFKTQYHRDRLCDQIDYFFAQSRRSERDGRRLKTVAAFCVGLAVLLVVLWAGSKAKFGMSYTMPGAHWLSLSMLALFEVATVCGALLVVHDCDRRGRRYHELSIRLQAWEQGFGALRTWASVLKVVNRVERALLAEMLEWRSLVGNTKLPRK